MAESIFPELKVVTPKVLCECIGDAVMRVIHLGRVTEPCLSNHIQEPTDDSQGALEFPEGFGF